MDRHIIETIGKTRVTVENGKVVNVEESEANFEYCPIVHRNFNTKKSSPELAKAGVEMRISHFGFCTKNRYIKSNDVYLSFGTSELMSCALRDNLLDAAIEPCDGAGTIITARPEITQGIGQVMSGLVKTSPIPEVIERLRGEGCVVVDPKNACIDQAKGLEKAFNLGYKRVGVSIACLDDVKRCREVEKRLGRTAVLFGAHLSGVSEDEAKKILELIDIVSSGASSEIRKHAGRNALLQLGDKIPAFVMTEVGRDIALNRVRYMKKKMIIKSEKLPGLSGKQPKPLF